MTYEPRLANYKFVAEVGDGLPDLIVTITENACRFAFSTVSRLGIALAVGSARGFAMWNWFNCYLSGRHDFGVWCEPGAIFLRCIHCGKRSSGWTIDAHVSHPHAPKPTGAPGDRAVPARIRAGRVVGPEPRAVVQAIDAPAAGARVLPFDRVVVQ